MASTSEEPMAGSCFCSSISSRTSQIPCLHLTQRPGLERPRVQLVLVLCPAQAYPQCLLTWLGEGLRGHRIGEGGSHEWEEGRTC